MHDRPLTNTQLLFHFGLRLTNHWQDRGTVIPEGHDFQVLVEETLQLLARLKVVPGVNGADIPGGIFAARWVLAAGNVLKTTEKYAAALAATEMSPEQAEEVRPPWPAFYLQIPPDTLLIPGQRRESWVRLQGIGVYTHPVQGNTGAIRWTFVAYGADGSVSFQWGRRATQLVTEEGLTSGEHDAGPGQTGPAEGPESRVFLLLARLVLNICAAMMATPDIAKPEPISRKKGGPGGDPMVPSLRGWKVGEPLTVDCRAAVQRFLKDGTWTERGNPKTARTLVRGHSQRYRTGPGKEKVVWVRKEPFFNPKHGPTLIRPVSLAPSPEEGP